MEGKTECADDNKSTEGDETTAQEESIDGERNEEPNLQNNVLYCSIE